MDRRNFLGALLVGAAAPLAPRRIYSFLWDNPLVVVPDYWLQVTVNGIVKYIKIFPREATFAETVEVVGEPLPLVLPAGAPIVTSVGRR